MVLGRARMEKRDEFYVGTDTGDRAVFGRYRCVCIRYSFCSYFRVYGKRKKEKDRSKDERKILNFETQEGAG